jgi:hypothetical protein
LTAHNVRDVARPLVNVIRSRFDLIQHVVATRVHRRKWQPENRRDPVVGRWAMRSQRRQIPLTLAVLASRPANATTPRLSGARAHRDRLRGHRGIEQREAHAALRILTMHRGHRDRSPASAPQSQQAPRARRWL